MTTRLMALSALSLSVALYALAGDRIKDASAAVGYQGTLTFSTTGQGDPFNPAIVQDLDLSSGQLTVRFQGLDATRAPRGEVAYIARLQPGYVADHGIVVADARGVAGAPLHVCKSYHYANNRVCSTPKLSPNGQFVAFGERHGGGKLCHDNFNVYFADYVTIKDRKGSLVSALEGFSYPEWLPNGRLIMIGTSCRNAGLWVTDASFHNANRIDGNRIATAASFPAVSPDGSKVAFTWNSQLWMTTLGRTDLVQLTSLPNAVQAGAWSPDGRTIAVLTLNVSVPAQSLVLVRPDGQESATTQNLTVTPFAPLSWR